MADGGMMSVDIEVLYDAAEQMNPSRQRLHDAIIALNKVRLELGEGETWQGPGAAASLETFTRLLNGILSEENRLSEIANTLRSYADELLANEQTIARAANDINDGTSAGGGTWMPM